MARRKVPPNILGDLLGNTTVNSEKEYEDITLVKPASDTRQKTLEKHGTKTKQVSKNAADTLNKVDTTSKRAVIVGDEQKAEKKDALAEIQLVVFNLASELYGVNINDVLEIIRMQTITRVPGAPDSVEGVINLRERVIPVVDLRKRLNLEVREQTDESRIVVVNISGRDVGVIVDGVSEILTIPPTSIEPPSSIIANHNTSYLNGIIKLENKLIILLDIGKLLPEVANQTNMDH